MSSFSQIPSSYRAVGLEPTAADNSARLIAALQAGLDVDLGGREFFFTNPVIASGVNLGTVRNGTLNFSTMSAQAGTDYCVGLYGSKGTGVALASNTAAGSKVVAVGSTSSFTVNGLVFLSSAAVWDSSTSTTYGHYGRVKSIDSPTQLTLFENVFLSFNTADSAVIAPVTPCTSKFDNVKLIGSGTSDQIGLYVEYGENVQVTRCDFRALEYTSLGFWRCYASVIDLCKSLRNTNSGAAYGFAIWGGCYACSVTNSRGEDNRHTVTIGDNDGLNLFTVVTGNIAIASKDAGFDSHSASMFTTFSNNVVNMSAAVFGSSNHDGMISQGAHTVFSYNTVIGPKGDGIVYDPQFQNGDLGSVLIIGNKVVLDAAGNGSSQAKAISVGINASVGANIKLVAITGNDVSGGASNPNGANGIVVRPSKASSSILKLIIEGNTTSVALISEVILVYASGASSSVSSVNISNNIIATSHNYAVYLLASGASSSIAGVTGGGNDLTSANACMYLNGNSGTVSDVKMGKNSYHTATYKFSLGGTVTGYVFDDAALGAPVTFTNSTATLLPTSNTYFFNRNSTITALLPDPTKCLETLTLMTVQAFTVVSASSNVVPRGSTSAGTAILAASAGAWATLKSDGTNWRVIAAG